MRRAAETAPMAYPLPRDNEYLPVVTYPMIALSPATSFESYSN